MFFDHAGWVIELTRCGNRYTKRFLVRWIAFVRGSRKRNQYSLKQIIRYIGEQCATVCIASICNANRLCYNVWVYTITSSIEDATFFWQEETKKNDWWLKFRNINSFRNECYLDCGKNSSLQLLIIFNIIILEIRHFFYCFCKGNLIY